MECWPAPGVQTTRCEPRAPSERRRGRRARPDMPQPLTLVEAIIPIASLIVLVVLSYYLFGDAGVLDPKQVALVLDGRGRIGMKTKTLMVLFLVALAGCFAKQQKVTHEATEECNAARDAALRAAQSCEKCCNRVMQK